MHLLNHWSPPAPSEEQHEALLRQAVERAWRSPFMAKKLIAADLAPGESVGQDYWSKLPMLTKDELRVLSPEAFSRDFVIAPIEDIADYWRSGGVTGKPLCYPRTQDDLLAGVESIRRIFEMVGLGPGHKAAMSFPLGIHPVGRLMLLALYAQGVAVVGLGAGTNTPTEQQIDLILSLKADTLLAMGTYAAHLASAADHLGIDLTNSRVERILSTADIALPGKRQRIERLWGASLFDSYGMSECGHLASECRRHNGMHVWTDMFHVEALDPTTWQPVAPGETGMLVVTPLYTNHATPFLRWVSGDIVTLTSGCDCGSPYANFPLLHFAGRTSGFFKLRGININHHELEELLLSFDEVTDYLITALMEHEQEVLCIELELRKNAREQDVCPRVQEAIARTFGLVPEVACVPHGSISARLVAHVKQNRVIDQRFKESES